MGGDLREALKSEPLCGASIRYLIKLFGLNSSASMGHPWMRIKLLKHSPVRYRMAL